MVVLVGIFYPRDIWILSAGCFSSLSLVQGGRGLESLDTERISVWERNHYSVSQDDLQVDLQVDHQTGAAREKFPGKSFAFGSE